jgi:hypothetical protein
MGEAMETSQAERMITRGLEWMSKQDGARESSPTVHFHIPATKTNTFQAVLERVRNAEVRW